MDDRFGDMRMEREVEKADRTIEAVEKISQIREPADTPEGRSVSPHKIEDPRSIQPDKKPEPVRDLELDRIQVSSGALRAIDVLQSHGYNADLVGGCVRDAMMGLKPKDEDITTNLEPDKVSELFQREGFLVVPTGIQHGTVTVMIPDEKGKLEGYEITTYRIDGQSSDHRHPDSVTFSSDIREDMARRDFTINAMSFDPRATGDDRIKDFFGGREDLKKGIIRTVGNPDDRIKEDALRMMRAVRFAAQKDMQIDGKLRESISANARDIEKVSKERINAELTKILESDRASQGLRDLHDLGLMRYISPQLDKEYGTPQHTSWHLYNVGEHTEVVVANTPNDIVTRCAAMLHDIGKTETRTTDAKGIDHFFGHARVSEQIAKPLMEDLKFPRDTITKTCQLIRLHDERLDSPTREDVCSFLDKHPNVTPENMYRLFDLQIADVRGQNPERTAGEEERIEAAREIYTQIIQGPFRTQDLALSGDDIRSITSTSSGSTIILSGPDIGVANERLLSHVIRYPESNNPQDLTKYLRDNLKSIKNASIERMSDSKKDSARQDYRDRVSLDKVKKEIQKVDVSELRNERDSIASGAERGQGLERAQSLVDRYNEILSKIAQKDSQSTPTVTSAEREYLSKI